LSLDGDFYILSDEDEHSYAKLLGMKDSALVKSSYYDAGWVYFHQDAAFFFKKPTEKQQRVLREWAKSQETVNANFKKQTNMGFTRSL